MSYFKVLIVLFSLLFSSLYAESDVYMRDELEQTLIKNMFAMMNATQTTQDQYEADGWKPQVNIMRSDNSLDESWVFGSVVLMAPHREGAYPLGWLFVAQAHLTGWTAELEGSPLFYELISRSPTSLVPQEEKKNFLSVFSALADNQTGMRLPFGLNQSWYMGGGPHGWGGQERPFSSIDLSGGDQRVVAARGGTAYTLCGNGLGWIRIIHDNGYTTDYYHLWNNIRPPGAGQKVGEGTYLGDTGVDVSCGGVANGRHVHFALRIGNQYIPVHWKSFGQWVLWEGNSAYQGFALHGSSRVDSGGCCVKNFGVLGANQGIVDSNGGSTVNKRSGPGSGYSVVGTVLDGAVVTITCHTTGTQHTGRYGTSNLWNKLNDGTWISDAFVYTGTDGLGPVC